MRMTRSIVRIYTKICADKQEDVAKKKFIANKKIGLLEKSTTKQILQKFIYR